MITESDVEGYCEINVPEDLLENIGYVIGKNGYYFKKITEASGVSFIWFNKDNKTIEICCTDTPFNFETEDFCFADDVIGATPEDVDDVLMDKVSEYIESARERIFDRFERCRSEMGSMPRKVTLADYMRDL
jgi:hypothetical protein